MSDGTNVSLALAERLCASRVGLLESMEDQLAGLPQVDRDWLEFHAAVCLPTIWADLLDIEDFDSLAVPPWEWSGGAATDVHLPEAVKNDQRQLMVKVGEYTLFFRLCSDQHRYHLLVGTWGRALKPLEEFPRLKIRWLGDSIKLQRQGEPPVKNETEGSESAG